jgi:hypothetical protein
MKKLNLDLLYKLTATTKYNSERRELLEDVILDFIKKRPTILNIKSEVEKCLIKRKEDEISDKQHMFKSYDALQPVTHNEIDEYVIHRYSKYRDIFKKRFGFGQELIRIITDIILLHGTEICKQTNFRPYTYAFKNKEEYGNMNFISIPDDYYITSWKKITTFNIADIYSVLIGTNVPVELVVNLSKILDLFSFTMEDVENNSKIRLQSTPILKIDQVTYIVLSTRYLKLCLPQKYELLMRKIKKYTDIKGKAFEKMSLDIIKKINSDTHKNILYEDENNTPTELDGLSNFKKTSWFVECTSRPPSMKSLMGSTKSIEKDLHLTVEKCISQATRAIRNHTNKNILKYNPKENKGIIVILDGLYPNLNPNYIFPLTKTHDTIPIYVVNYIFLKTISEQHDIYLFEDFLIWRTQKDIPIICLDELDYWDYFTKMKNNKKEEEIFNTLKEKKSMLVFIGNRFNSKSYLENIVIDHERLK